ncbi:MAG: SOUL family heme-binding protein [Planctomycetota bacterium]|jgi:hypothetical protein
MTTPATRRPLHRRLLRWPLLVAAGLISVTVPFGCSVFGVHFVDEPPHTVERQDGAFEIRRYEPMVVVETVVDAGFDQAGNTAFRRLYGYITGENAARSEFAMTAPVLAAPGAGEGQEFAMTAPVLGERTDRGWRYAFVLPADVSAAEAPAPTNPDVVVAEVPARRVAVYRFTGGRGGAAAPEREQALRDWMATNDLTAASEPRIAGYDPPWTLPWFRRNEVMIEVR